MNYVKLLTISALLLVVPAANALSTPKWVTDTKAWMSGQFDALKKKQSKTVIAGEALVGGLALYGAYTYIKPVNKAVNAVGSKAAEYGKELKKSRKQQIIAASTLGVVGLGLLAWKYGKCATGWFSKSSQPNPYA